MGGQHVEHLLVAGMALADGFQRKGGQVREAHVHGGRVQGLVDRNAVRIIFQFVFQRGKLGGRILLGGGELAGADFHAAEQASFLGFRVQLDFTGAERPAAFQKAGKLLHQGLEQADGIGIIVHVHRLAGAHPKFGLLGGQLFFCNRFNHGTI